MNANVIHVHLNFVFMEIKLHVYATITGAIYQIVKRRFNLLPSAENLFTASVRVRKFPVDFDICK